MEKRELINNTFSNRDGSNILQIPLPIDPHDDLVIWRGEPSSTFSVRSAYKLLHEGTNAPNLNNLQTTPRDFYKKLWNLKLPSKTKNYNMESG